jgi:tight adherence protein C
MILLVILGVLLVGTTAALLGRALAFGRLRMLAQVRQIGTYGFKVRLQDDDAPKERSPLVLAANALAERVGRFGAARLSMEPLPLSQLLAAGLYQLTPYALNGYRLILGVGLPTLELLNGIASGSLGPLTVLLAILLGGIGFSVPRLIVLQRAGQRLDRIDRDLPELVDVLTATIESGLSFGGSLQLVSDRFHGPLGDELRLTLREQMMGLSTDQALQNMLLRCDTPSVRAFVRAVRQAESMGVSIGQMMRNLAGETRNRRRELAHERIQKAPVKMLFPLVFLIFPSIMIVLLYPAVHSVITQLGSS